MSKISLPRLILKKRHNYYEIFFKIALFPNKFIDNYLSNIYNESFVMFLMFYSLFLRTVCRLAQEISII